MKSELFIPEGQYDKIAIICPGPSLTKEDACYATSKGIFTIAVGIAYTFNPFADILYHCDAHWWNHYDGVADFHGCARVSLEDTGRQDIRLVKQSDKKEGFDLTPSTVVTGRNSGYQALNLALHYKPKEIILLGYDMKKAADGKYNIIGDHPKEVKRPAGLDHFVLAYDTLVKPLDEIGVKVYNCSRDTALTAFERRDLRDVI